MKISKAYAVFGADSKQRPHVDGDQYSNHRRVIRIEQTTVHGYLINSESTIMSDPITRTITISTFIFRTPEPKEGKARAVTGLKVVRSRNPRS